MKRAKADDARSSKDILSSKADVSGEYAVSGASSATNASGEFAVARGRRQHDVLDTLPTPLVVVDGLGRITVVNQRAVRLLGCSAASLLGSAIGELIAPLESIRAAAAAPDAREFREHLTLPDASHVVVSYRVQRLPPDSEQSLESYAVALQDVTAVEELRDERDRLLRLAAVSELRRSVFPELDAFGTTDDESPSLPTSAVDQALRESFAALEREAFERGVHFQCVVLPMPPLPFDLALIRAIAFNLLTNAIHASKQDGFVRLGAEIIPGSPATLRLSVADSGTGMPEDVVARCRELFFTTKPRGTGLGLTLCDRAARAAGGTLSVESQQGLGTLVTLEVPVRDTALLARAV